MSVVQHTLLLAAFLTRSYENYLSSFVTEAELKYLQDADTARRVVELGCARRGRC